DHPEDAVDRAPVGIGLPRHELEHEACDLGAADIENRDHAPLQRRFATCAHAALDLVELPPHALSPWSRSRRARNPALADSVSRAVGRRMSRRSITVTSRSRSALPSCIAIA